MFSSMDNLLEVYSEVADKEDFYTLVYELMKGDLSEDVPYEQFKEILDAQI